MLKIDTISRFVRQRQNINYRTRANNGRSRIYPE